MTSDPRRLSVVLDEYPHTVGFLSGDLSDPRLAIEPRWHRPIWDAFGAMVERQEFDVSEMAMATYVLARAAGKPITMLPITMLARFQHPFIVQTARRRLNDPRRLSGLRVGVRSYTQTTGVWIRGILSRQFNLEPSEIEWVTFETPHVDGYVAPPFVSAAPPGRSMAQLLDEGYLAAAVVSHELTGVSDALPLFDDLERITRDWYDLTGVVQVNHAVCVPDALLDEEPETVAAVVEVLRRGRDLVADSVVPIGAPAWAHGLDWLPFGRDAFAPAMDLMRELCIEQGLIGADLALPDLRIPGIDEGVR